MQCAVYSGAAGHRTEPKTVVIIYAYTSECGRQYRVQFITGSTVVEGKDA